MSSSRREFLKKGTWLALAAGVPLSLTETASAVGLSTTKTPSGLSRAAFESQLGTTFVVHNQGSKVKVKLVDVTNLASARQDAKGKEGFSLKFQGLGDTRLEQNTFVIEHETLGMFSFLMVPIKLKKSHTPHYEVVINRLYP